MEISHYSDADKHRAEVAAVVGLSLLLEAMPEAAPSGGIAYVARSLVVEDRSLIEEEDEQS